jgi:transcription elongation factor GreB
MNKAFTRESDAADDEGDDAAPLSALPQGTKNYVTPAGYARLREIDRRIRFLTKRLDIAEVVDPSVLRGRDQVFFGATVTYANEQGEERTVTIKGIDEADSAHGEVSWIAPISRALLKAKVGDEVPLVTPGGMEKIEVVAVRYPGPAKEG